MSARLALVALVAFAVVACGGKVADKYVIQDQPATLEEIAGSTLKAVILTPDAVTRVGITTSEVMESADGLVVPVGALWMDVEGVFWVYTNPAPNRFVRETVVVADADATVAVLSAGPPPGTVVVTTGVPELYGAEVGVGK